MNDSLRDLAHEHDMRELAREQLAADCYDETEFPDTASWDDLAEDDEYWVKPNARQIY